MNHHGGDEGHSAATTEEVLSYSPQGVITVKAEDVHVSELLLGLLMASGRLCVCCAPLFFFVDYVAFDPLWSGAAAHRRCYTGPVEGLRNQFVTTMI